MTNRSWLRLHMAFLALLLPHAASGGGAAASFSLSPLSPNKAPYFQVVAVPGERLTLPMAISNVGNASGTVKLYAVDMTTGVTSGAIFENQNDPRLDVGAWLQVPLTTLTLAPQQERILDLQLTVPLTVRAGQHLGGVVAEQQPSAAAEQKGAQIAIQVRNALAVEVTLPGATNEDLHANGVQMHWNDTPATMALALQNAGTQLLKAQGVVQILTTHEHVAWQRTLQIDTLVPQTSIQYPVFLSGATLPAGQYTVALTLAYGTNKHLFQQWTISLPHPIVAPSPKNAPQSGFAWGFWEWLGLTFLVIFGLLGWFRPVLVGLIRKRTKK